MGLWYDTPTTLIEKIEKYLIASEVGKAKSAAESLAYDLQRTPHLKEAKFLYRTICRDPRNAIPLATQLKEKL